VHTVFLFTEHFDKENGFCLRLDEQGEVDMPLERRTIDEIRALQANAKTVIIVPTERTSLHEVELPWLSEGRARAAIPYALEEELAESVGSLHFSFDRQHYHANHYLVVVINKQIVRELMDMLDSLHLVFDVITLDWFALNTMEACVVENNILVDDTLFKGALSLDLAELYFKEQVAYSHILVFNDSVPLSHMADFTKVDSDVSTWIAKRLLKNKPMNLCQGEFQHDTSQTTLKRWYQLAACIAGACLISFLALTISELYVVNHRILAVDAKIAVIYREFFPDARVIISPRFRIEQLLKNNQTNRHALLWDLLEKLAMAVMLQSKSESKTSQSAPVVVSEIRFQNNQLSVTLACRDFATLERFEQGLQQEQVVVHQTEAATHAAKVVATLELTL